MARAGRELSKQVVVCLNKLYKLQNSKWLELIQRSGEYAAIPYLVPFLSSDDHMLEMAAENTISDLLRRCPPHELIWLSEQMREHLPYAYRENNRRWTQLTTAIMGSWSHSVHPVKWIMASFHPDGYVREAAVKRIVLIRDGSEIPFLLIRMNDWVSSIRFRAHKALQQRIHEHNADIFIQNIALVQRLTDCGREHRERYDALIEAVYELLRRPACAVALQAGMQAEEVYIRRFCFQLGLQCDHLNTEQLLQWALQDVDSSIRIWAARQVSQRLQGDNLLSVLEYMRHDSFPPVRREALEQLTYGFREQAAPYLHRSLLDRNAVVREVARRCMSIVEPLNLVEFYLDTIWNAENDSSKLATALYGLGETGQAEDAEVIAEEVDHPEVAVRKAVIRGLARLDIRSYGHVLRAALLDPQPGISREAVPAIRRHIYILNRDEWLYILSETYPRHVHRNLLRLLPAYDRWEQLDMLLDILNQDTASWIRQAAGHQLNRWIHQSNRSFHMRPSEEKADDLLDKLKACERRMDSNKAHMLRWMITS
ncbi:HEAT repeat domain-containing protein [Paenibacillus sp. WLX1005]|uniref:HEAT repeat domain-containing protein n=1 Tax=Paenibacillus sp. WLX1005 TaxID=3243766 RepID=UPI00398402E1